MKTHKATRDPSRVVITPRDLTLFAKLAAAGWLTTRQVRDYFFPGKSANAVSKRLRRLACAGYVALARTGSTDPGLYRLSGKGKLALAEGTDIDPDSVVIPTQLPRKLAHFVAVNDLRLRFEQLGTEAGCELRFFFSERELARFNSPHLGSYPVVALLSSYRVIPDALAGLGVMRDGVRREVTLALEYDAGTEHAAYFARTKVVKYAALFAEHGDELGDFKVLTFARGVRRLVSLMREAVRCGAPHHLFYFASMEKLEETNWTSAGVFLDPHDYLAVSRRGGRAQVAEKELPEGRLPRHALVSLPATSPRSLYPRGETTDAVSRRDTGVYAHEEPPVI